MLQEYQKKRDFRQTPEPQMAGKTRGGALIFVVQQHYARQLHYDFRLEVDGVLKSWAVAKGPSLDPGTKRLAVMVEDHPLDYAGFEGIIPAGQYGGGQVIIWDRGTYSPDEDGDLHFNDRNAAEKMMRQGLAAGKISMTLRGEKLKGSWTLVRMQKTEKNWLLIKHHDEYADSSRDVLSEGKSVASGLTVADLKTGRLPGKDPPPVVKPGEIPGAAKKPIPTAISPMLASLASAPFSDEQWLFEPKLDGFRTLAFLNRGKVRLQSRSGLDVTSHYRPLVQSLEKQPASQLVLDGEIIALDARGKLCFQCLQGYLKSINRLPKDKIEAPSAIIYYVFDILYLDGYDLKKVPLKTRKELLQNIVVPDDSVRLVEHFAKDGETVYRAAIANSMEGVVAKRQDSLYEEGKRAKTWLKIKAVNSDEFVICGYTPGTGSRAKTFGALVLGYYDVKNVLQPAGNVGTGFDDSLLQSLRKQMDLITVKKSPFRVEVEGSDTVIWVRPELVAEIKFAEWTKDGRLRAPVFLRLRDDKPLADIHPARVIETDPSTARRRTVKNIIQPDNLLSQLDSKEINLTLEVAGQKLSFSNLDKILWPERAGQKAVTKRALIIYLAKVSPYLLPHLKDRPLSLSRYPNGVDNEHFFQKHYSPVPDFVETVPLSSHDTPAQEYLVCNNLATLLWLGQIADIELHTWFSRVKPGPDFKVATRSKKDADFYADYPDFLIFDIDPYIYSGKEAAGEEPELNRAAFRQTCRVALMVKQTLAQLACPSFVKTSGKTGLHVFIPIKRQLNFHGTHQLAEKLSKFLQQKYPDAITTDWAVEKRKGKIFLDYNQNVRGKTLASIYSPRPAPGATVSVPLNWDELDRIYPADFTIANVPDRLAKLGDLWANILDAKIDIVRLFSDMKLDSPAAIN
jgi:bifunctional non-homologous end joining protein LigD